MKKRKRRWGDRRDGRLVRDANGMNKLFCHLLPKRTEAEVCLHDILDVTAMMPYLEAQNAAHPNFKTTIFHCLLFAVARMIRERPELNRFIQGHKIYERDEITLSFVAKRRFADGAEESLMVLKVRDEDTLADVSHRIYGDVTQMRKVGHSSGNADKAVDIFAKMPPLLAMFIVRIIRYMDFWGINPEFITNGDPNYTTVLFSNLGSIQCPSVYHHLNNYGTNSIMITLGTIHKDEVVMPDGHREIRDVVDVSATLDERIADGFYFARSLKLVKHIFAHPELLDLPLGEPSNFTYQ